MGSWGHSSKTLAAIRNNFSCSSGCQPTKAAQDSEESRMIRNLSARFAAVEIHDLRVWRCSAYLASRPIATLLDRNFSRGKWKIGRNYCGGHLPMTRFRYL